jgi:PAS domain S-box-containing protein
MNHSLLQKKNSYRIFIEIAVASLILAIVFYILLSKMIGIPPFQGISRAIIIPIIVAPLMSYRLLQLVIKLDVTEAALQQSEIRYKSIVENSHDGILIVDDNYHLIYVNPELCNMLGYAIDEIIGKDFRRFLDEESQKIVTDNYLGRQRGQEASSQYEFNIVHKNGDTRRVQIRSTAIKDLKNGTQTYAQLLDITEKRATEKALQQSEKTYRDIFENTGTATVIIDKNKKILTANTEFVQLSGYSKEEIEGQMSWTNFVSENDLLRMKQYHSNRRKGSEEVPTVYEFKFVDRSGNEKYILNKVNMISGTEKSVASLLDITEITNAKIELKESENKFRSITSSAKDAIIMMDGSGKISYWNKAAEGLFGYSGSEIVGEELHRVIAPADQCSNFFTAFPKFQKSGNGSVIGKTIELTGLNKEGLRFPIELSVSALKQDGEWYSIGIVRDISNRKKLEKELRQAYKMEAIGTLAAGIAHDFNNILSAIVGYTQLLQLRMPNEDKAANHINEILKACNRAKELVQQILTFSRQSEHELKPVSVVSIVKEALKLLRASLPATIEIKQNLKGESLVMGDPTQIHQILMNLCTNASHAMQAKGGLLEIDLQDTILGQDITAQYPDLKPGSYLKLTVSDTGHGIPRNVLEQIFNPFFTTKEKGEGTGMGLAVVHGIVKKYGGNIGVYSEPGKGSKFDVFIPAIESDVTPDKNTEEAVSGGTEQILIVDDEPALVEIGEQFLRGLGYRVVSRTSSMEVLSLLKVQSDKFDLVITDMTMPQMTGVKLAEELAASRIDIPIILCTGFSHGMTAEKARQIGIKGIIMKPIIRSELAKIVRQVLDESKTVA